MLPKILSEMARPISYVNYFAPVSPILNEEQKAAFQKIDHEHEVVWVAINPESSNQAIIGVGRLLRFEGKPWLAELSLAVDKGYQHRDLEQFCWACFMTWRKRKISVTCVPSSSRKTNALSTGCDGWVHRPKLFVTGLPDWTCPCAGSGSPTPKREQPTVPRDPQQD